MNKRERERKIKKKGDREKDERNPSKETWTLLGIRGIPIENVSRILISRVRLELDSIDASPRRTDGYDR